MKVLGILGSGRKGGNSEILLQLALRGAQEMGASVEQIRLTDYNISSCTGCMGCVIKDRDCRLGDDINEIFEKLSEAEGLIVSAPIYALGPAAATKLFLDRLLIMARKTTSESRENFVAATITTAGLPSHNPMGELINLVPLAFGYQMADYLVAYGPGPGEVLLNEGIDKRAVSLGKRVVGVSQGKMEMREPGENQCPACYGELFKLSADGRLICAICDTIATVIGFDPTGGWQLQFSEDALNTHRFTQEKREKHINNWIIKSKDRYMENLPAIKAKLSEIE